MTALMTCIRKVPVPNPGHETKQNFDEFPHIIQVNAERVPQLLHDNFLSRNIRFVTYSSTFDSIHSEHRIIN